MSDEREIQKAIQRTVGIAVLKKLGRLAQQEEAQERNKARWARRLSLAFVVAILLAAAWWAWA
ncbi:MAG TPA: hypothetical protein VJ001_11675 [Rhodocyclaceae bacterium]|nr:hypothetical protein [Rhodocyclaceae bacterium]